MYIYIYIYSLIYKCIYNIYIYIYIYMVTPLNPTSLLADCSPTIFSLCLLFPKYSSPSVCPDVTSAKQRAGFCIKKPRPHNAKINYLLYDHFIITRKL